MEVRRAVTCAPSPASEGPAEISKGVPGRTVPVEPMFGNLDSHFRIRGVKFSIPITCDDCGEFLVDVTGTQLPRDAQCPECSKTIWLVEPVGNIVGMAIMHRAATELAGGDSTLTIVFAAMAVESQLAYVCRASSINCCSGASIGCASLSRSDRSTEGSMIGFMLASLSFLEKYKTRFPDTYERATKVAESSGIYAADSADSSDMSHFENLQQGAGAMYFLLGGIAASNTISR